MDAITNGWGTTIALHRSPSERRARRIARALAALERWADRGAEALATAPTPARGEAWADGAQSALSDVAARPAELGRWVRVESARSASALDELVAGERAWCEAARAEALAAAQTEIDVEQLHALGRAELLTQAARRLAALRRRPTQRASHRMAARTGGGRDVATSRRRDARREPASSQARETAGHGATS